MTTLLIDDEEDNRITLRNFLTRYCPNVQIVAEAASVAEACREIEQHAPDLVFLDINMPHENGFALFQKIPEPEFYTVFVTAYDEYALQAIKQQALDYILKPVNITELVQAVARAEQLKSQAESAGRLERLMSVVAPKAAAAKIGLPTTSGFIYVPVADIIRCEAEGNYTQFYCIGRRPILVCRTLGNYEAALKDHGFIRVHHQHLINLKHVEQYKRGRGGTVLMADKSEVIVSQRKKDDFLNAMNNSSIIEQ